MEESRDRKRARIKEANRLLKLPPGALKEIDLSSRDCPPWMTRAFSNNRYVVMIEDNAKTDKGTAIKAMIQKHDNRPIPNHWRELQNIKNELFGEETMAIEYYPKESHLMDDHNIYWLWIFPEGILPVPEV